MPTKDMVTHVHSQEDSPTVRVGPLTLARLASKVITILALVLFVCGLAWNFSTRRYLTGFADAIIPLTGTQEEKTEALVEWFHHEPRRNISHATGPSDLMDDRDPVNIVQSTRLLKICGSASNAFMNLANASGLKVRRLLLIDQAGNAKHVVAEVQWGDRWIVVNPQQGLIFKDKSGHALTRQELRDPKVFQDAISRMPGYDPQYTFDRTIHVRLSRIPVIGKYMRGILDRSAPGWEEAINWTYFPEYPPLWLIFASGPLFLVGILGIHLTRRYPHRK